jgi:hypothetical protein
MNRALRRTLQIFIALASAALVILLGATAVAYFAVDAHFSTQIMEALKRILINGTLLLALFILIELKLSTDKDRLGSIFGPHRSAR